VTDHTLAPALDAYRTVTGITEDELLRAVASGLVARPCACGGVVVADVTDPTDGMIEHQATDLHRRWREWRET
jgi:hypothetical protein